MPLDIDQLNSLLDREMKARDTYQHAIEVTEGETIVKVLLDNLSSHEYRIGRLAEAIRILEGQPTRGSIFLKAVAAAVDKIDFKSARFALEVLRDQEHDVLTHYNELGEKEPDDELLPQLKPMQEKVIAEVQRALAEIETE